MDERTGVALEYSEDVPRIVAVAQGILFDKLIEIAKKYDITLYEDRDLVEVLSRMKVGDEIPPDLYRAVTEVLAFCYEVNEDFKKKFDSRIGF